MPEIWILCGLAIVVVGSFVAVCWYHRSAEKKRKHRFTNRTSMSFDEWFSSFYTSDDGLDREKIQTVLNIFSDWMRIDATQLRPDDDLISDLSISSQLLNDESWEVWHHKLGKCLGDDFVSRFRLETEWKSLDDLIRSFCVSPSQHA